MSGSQEMELDLLQERFPEISFFLSLHREAPLVLIQDEKGYFTAQGHRGGLYGEDVQEELEKWKNSLFLSGIDVLYIYGVGLGYYYKVLQDWLLEKKERALVFIEDDLSVLEALFSLPMGSEILKDPQVHLSYLSKDTSFDEILDESVQHLISDRVDLTALLSYSVDQEKKIKALRLSLLRKSTLIYVGMAELLHYHVLMENISSNFFEVVNSFHVNKLKNAFKNVPAIICGAGVSLGEAVSDLKKCEQKALLFAGGSAITALSYQGIRPHIAMALDPNDEEYTRLKSSSSFEMPFVYSSRLNKDVLLSTNMKSGYLCSDTGGVFESWMQEQLGMDLESLGSELGMEALSVTTLAIPLARHLGCSPILFCGVDLSYRNNQRYTEGVLPSSAVFFKDLAFEKRSMEKPVRRKNGAGKIVNTLVKWVMEASCISSYVKKHPEAAFFSASAEGLPIPGVPVLSVEEFLKRYCKKEYDLRGLVQAEGEMASFSFSKESVKEAFSSLVTSLEECLPLFDQMSLEIEKKLELVSDLSVSHQSGRMSLLEMDLQENPAYAACLQCSFAAYQKILERSYPSLDPLDTEAGRRNFLEKKRHLWKECSKVTEACLDLIRRHVC